MVAASVVDHRYGGMNRFGQLFQLAERFFALRGRVERSWGGCSFYACSYDKL